MGWEFMLYRLNSYQGNLLFFYLILNAFQKIVLIQSFVINEISKL